MENLSCLSSSSSPLPGKGSVLAVVHCPVTKAQCARHAHWKALLPSLLKVAKKEVTVTIRKTKSEEELGDQIQTVLFHMVRHIPFSLG